MASPPHPSGRGRSRRSSRSANHSPGMVDMRRGTDDSEAETEILSANNTPAKARKFGQMEMHEGNSDTKTNKRQDDVHDATDDNLADSEADGGTLTISSRRDRKLHANEVILENAASPKAPESLSRPTSSSSKKRARLGRSLNVKSEEDEKEHPEGEGLRSPRLTRAHSSNFHLSSPPSAYTTESKRATTQEPRSRSRSVSPSSRRLHKRSSSFASTVSAATRERKQRNRRTLREESLVISPTEATSPPRSDAYPSERLTPGHHAHAAHMPHLPHKDNTGRTNFSKSCERGNLIEVKACLDRPESKYDINEPDYAGNRPLQFAALKGHADVVEVLINAGCEFKAIDNAEGDTPLMDAIGNGHVEIVQILLAAGINPNPKNKKGRRAEDEIQDEEKRDEIMKLLSEARSKWRDEQGEQAAANRERGKTKKSGVEPLATRGSRRNTHLPHYLLYTTPTPANLRKFSEDGVEEGVRYLINCGIMADNSCAVAAAQRGHVSVLETLFTYGGAQSDPDPDEVGKSTPMLAAIGAGEVEVVRFLLRFGGFDAKREIDGKSYDEIATTEKGPRWQEVAEIFKTAEIEKENESTSQLDSPISPLTSPSPEPPRRRRLRTGREMAAERAESTTASTPEPIKDVPSKDSSPEPMQESHVRTPPRPETPPQPKTPPRPVTPPAERRRRYLSILPHALSRALTSGGHVHPHIDKRNAPASIRFLKSLEDWMPISIFQLGHIQPDCNPAKRTEAWILGFYASVFLRHERLDEVTTNLGWETIPVSPTLRKSAWEQDGLEAHLAKDHYWQHAPRKLQEASGVPMTYFTSPFGKDFGECNWSELIKSSRQKWFDLPNDQCVFVRLHDFLNAVKSSDAPHLRNLIIRFEIPNHPKQGDFFRLRFQNNMQIAEPLPKPGDLVSVSFWKTMYANFGEKWVVRNGVVEWVIEEL